MKKTNDDKNRIRLVKTTSKKILELLDRWENLLGEKNHKKFVTLSREFSEEWERLNPQEQVRLSVLASRDKQFKQDLLKSLK